MKCSVRGCDQPAEKLVEVVAQLACQNGPAHWLQLEQVDVDVPMCAAHHARFNAAAREALSVR